TGITFTNRLSDAAAAANQIRMNGSGVAAGDVDGDGWCDLYFCGLETGNRLKYRSRSEEHTSELQSLAYLVCRLLLEKKKHKEYASSRARRRARSQSYIFAQTYLLVSNFRSRLIRMSSVV